MSPVKYETGLYIPEDTILHSHCRENTKLTNTVSLYLEYGQGELVFKVQCSTVQVPSRKPERAMFLHTYKLRSN
jgi:hypothetical protein